MELTNNERRVCIVLLNWNGWRDTIQCLDSLRILDYQNTETILVDNGSTDDSVTQIRSVFPDVEVIEAGRNLGFAGGCNLGIQYALRNGVEYIWLLNNDTRVDPEALRGLVEKAESDTRIGAVGSTIYSMAKSDQLEVWGGGHINFWLGTSHHFSTPVNDEQIQFLTGASLFLRRSVVDRLGLLDEAFFMYWEDADYCFRLRRAGWRLAVASKSKIWHKEQGSVGKKSVLLDVYFNQSAVRFFKKYSSAPLVPVCASIPRRLARWALAGDWHRIRSVWKAVTQSEVVSPTL